MQREHPAAAIEIVEKMGDLTDILQLLDPRRIPLGARHADGSFDIFSLRKWWAEREIPASRSGLAHALESLRFSLHKVFAHQIQRSEPVRPVFGSRLARQRGAGGRSISIRMTFRKIWGVRCSGRKSCQSGRIYGLRGGFRLARQLG